MYPIIVVSHVFDVIIFFIIWREHWKERWNSTHIFICLTNYNIVWLYRYDASRIMCFRHIKIPAYDTKFEFFFLNRTASRRTCLKRSLTSKRVFTTQFVFYISIIFQKMCSLPSLQIVTPFACTARLYHEIDCYLLLWSLVLVTPPMYRI